MCQTLLQIFSPMSSGLKYGWFLFRSRLFVLIFVLVLVSSTIIQNVIIIFVLVVVVVDEKTLLWRQESSLPSAVHTLSRECFQSLIPRHLEYPSFFCLLTPYHLLFQICSWNSLFPTGLWCLTSYLSISESDDLEIWCFININMHINWLIDLKAQMYPPVSAVLQQYWPEAGLN